MVVMTPESKKAVSRIAWGEGSLRNAGGKLKR